MTNAITRRMALRRSGCRRRVRSARTLLSRRRSCSKTCASNWMRARSGGCHESLIWESSPRQGIQSSTRPCCHEWRHVGSTARRYQYGGLTEHEHGNYAYGQVERRKTHHLVMPHQPFAEAKGKQRADYRAAAGDKQVLNLEVTQYVDLSCANGSPYSNLPGPLTYPQTAQTDDARAGHA